MRISKLNILLLVLLWLALLALSTLLDASCAAWVYNTRIYLTVKYSHLISLIKFPGSFYCTLAVAFLLGLHHPKRWQAAGMLCTCGVMAGLLYSLVKWGVGRTRPVIFIDGAALLSSTPFNIHPFHKGLMGLLVAEKNQAFPSGHTCLAFATATALSIWFPRHRVFFFLLATIVGVLRVLEGAHYPSDVIAGAGLGILSTALVWWFWARIINPQTNTAATPVVEHSIQS